VLPGQRAGKMAAPMELFCWSGGWGLPSVDLDSLAVLTYARFTGAPLKVHKITNPWQSPSGTPCSWGVRKGWSKRRTGMWCKSIWIGS